MVSNSCRSLALIAIAGSITFWAPCRANEPVQSPQAVNANELRTEAFVDSEADAEKQVRDCIKALRDKNPRIREKACKTLADLAGESKEAKLAVPALVEALRDTDREVRNSALDALCEIRSPETIVPLLQVLVKFYKDQERAQGNEKASAQLNFLMVSAALQERGEDSLSALIDALKHRDTDVRFGAATVLKVLGPKAKSARAALQAAATKDESELVRRIAAQALKAIPND